MRNAKFLAGLATIFVFIGIYCFKALLQKNENKVETHQPVMAPLKSANKIMLIVFGTLSILLGVFLFIQCVKLI
jgi:hypothetical protein